MPKIPFVFFQTLNAIFVYWRVIFTNVQKINIISFIKRFFGTHFVCERHPLVLRFRGINFQSWLLYDCLFTHVTTLHWLWIQIESTTISIFLGKIQDQRHMWSQLSTCPFSAVHMSYGANNWCIYNSILNLDLVVFSTDKRPIIIGMIWGSHDKVCFRSFSSNNHHPV